MFSILFKGMLTEFNIKQHGLKVNSEGFKCKFRFQ